MTTKVKTISESVSAMQAMVEASVTSFDAKLRKINRLLDTGHPDRSVRKKSHAAAAER